MGQEAIHWTGPGHCWKGSGWSIFLKEETALLNGPNEVLFFQPWGTPRSAGTFEPVRTVPDLIRPPCQALSCGSPRVADLDGIWFECLSCGMTFMDEKFRLSMAPTKADGLKIVRIHRDHYREEARQLREIRLLDFIQKKAYRAAERAEQVARQEKKRKARPKTIIYVHPKPPAPPPAPPPRPPVYMSMVRFCEENRKKQLATEQARAAQAYLEWLERNPKVEISVNADPDLCPHGPAAPGIRILSDVRVNCTTCGHAFWVIVPMGVAKKQNSCLCCKKR